MNNCISIVIKVASFTFQIAGAILLLMWAVGNIDQKVIRMTSEHTGPSWGEFNGTGSYSTLEKCDLQKNAKAIYRNIVAFFNVILGYGLAIFMTETFISNWYILIAVAVFTALIVAIELFITSRYAEWKYTSAIKVRDDIAS